MFNLREFGSNERSIFQHSVELAMTQPQIDLRPAGHIALEDRERGGRYAYWMRYDQRKKLTKEYLGAEGSDEHLNGVARLEELKKSAHQAKVLRSLGYAAVENDAALVLAQLHNAGFFVGGGILIGTRAFGVLINHLGYTQTPLLTTVDIDVARLDKIHLAPATTEDGFFALLRRSGLNFAEVPSLSRPPGPATSYKVVGSELIVDLLVPAATNQEPYQHRAVPELNAHATMLPYLSFLLEESTMAMALGKSFMVPVRVPDPARYCLHKMLVSTLRPSIDRGKVSKDLLQAAALAVILSQEAPEHLQAVAQKMDDNVRARVEAALPRVLSEMSRWPGTGQVLEEAISADSPPEQAWNADAPLG